MNKYSILIVEDEALIAASLVQTLTSLGYAVQKPVATGEDAIRSVKARKPDLVLMDIVLIGAMDGIETAEKIRAIADIPIVYLTAFTDDTRLSKAQFTEPYGYIVKPAHKHVLHGTIEMALYKHRLDRKLKESEEKYRTLFENAVVGFFRTIPDGKLTNANMAYAKMYGYQDPDSVVRELTNIGVQVYANPDDRNKILATLAVQGYLEPTEVQVRHRDGHLFWVSVTARTVRDAEGKILEYEGTNVDVTERKRAEEALRKERDFAHSVVGTAQAIIMVLDIKGHIVYYNPYMEEISGYSLEKVKGKDWFETFLPPHVQESTRSLFRKAIGGIQTRGNVEVIITKDGRERLIEWYDKTLKGADGSIEGLLAIGQDVTERKKGEDTLRKSEEQYRSLLEHVPELILVHRNGTILYTNPAAVKTLGYQPYEALNRQVNDFIAPEFHERVAAAVRRRLEGVPVEPYEIDVLSRDGNRRTMIINGCQSEFEGTPASLIVLVDITNRKQTDLALRQANKQLNLLSSITRHDIKNQLLALRGYLELSRECLGDKKTLCDFLEKMEKSAKTIEDQITFTKDYQELGVAAPIWQNVNEGIRKAMVALPIRAVHVKPDPANPEVYSDPLFEKVFYNLIDNALKYGGDQMKTIRIYSQESDTSLTIVCEDDGVGISAEDKKRLFTRGFGKNTGLGLFLSREILGITGITITENGVTGKGARFEITVPKGRYRFMGTGGK